MITFRSLDRGDAEWMAAVSRDPDVVRYAEPERMDDPFTADGMREHKFPAIEAAQADGLWWGICEDGTPVGWVFLRRRDDGWELGYRLGKTAWGRGIATVAARAALDWAAEHGVDAVYATVAAPNAGSVRILEKLGFAHVGTGRWHGMDDLRFERPCG